MSNVATRPGRPTATPSPTPVEDKKGPGRPKADKKPYRVEGSEKLTEWPSDFDPKIHKPLQITDFEAEDVFLLRKAEIYEAKAKEYREKAAIFQQFGSGEARKAAEKYNRMMAKMAELEQTLREQGIDPSTVGTTIGE